MKYPIGIQSFEKLRKEGYAYIDKTALIYKLTRDSYSNFLSRPRRFGKSLLLSTIEAYFMGKKNLFEGLQIGLLETKWETYPVLHFDFSTSEALNTKKFEIALIESLKTYAQCFGVNLRDTAMGAGALFGYLLEDIHQATGKNIVVLIDEYDNGLLNTDEAQTVQANQQLLHTFFAQLKAKDNILRFCMLTGVSRFSHLTIFSGLNNLRDISLSPEYSAICGITEYELIDNFKEGINKTAQSLSLTQQALVDAMRIKYDGYRFSRSPLCVYNPFSIVNALNEHSLDNFWLQSGTSQVFIRHLKDCDFDLTDFENILATKDELCSPYDPANPMPLLFQTGYLTIKDYLDGFYKLGIPNSEVRAALIDELMPRYMGVNKSQLKSELLQIKRDLQSGNIDSLLTRMQSLFASAPYHLIETSNLEKTYHLMIYQLFMLLGIDTHSEIAMSGGRIDMVAETSKYTYVFEFKLGGTPEQALRQINSRGYALPWRSDGRKVLKIGVVFSPETRTLSSWQIE